MNQDLKQRITELVTGGREISPRSTVESRYPMRDLPEGAEVTRLCPSPTGFVHIGTIFTALLCQYVARQTDGVYMLRIEDTDKKREVEGAKELIASQLRAFGVTPDEGLQEDGTQSGNYGPYIQSERAELYWSFVIDLLQKDRAYPCFATPEELQEAVKDQQSKKLRPGYYGEWALWRDRSDADIETALEAGKPFVLRFRSNGSHERRVSFDDVLKGTLEFPENDLDVPLIKSDEWRLPTYHLAHVVDDYLMRATIIMRGEEWMPSTPLHLELCDALQIPRFRYGHTPVISIIDPKAGGKRKLSKRKDPEADVAYWLKAAYPIKAVKAYLLGLANSNFEDWYRAKPDAPLEEFLFTFEKLAASRSPLLDMKKVEDYARDEIARMSQEHFNKEILAWCEVHDKGLFEAMMKDPEYTKAVLAIERDGEKPRKDVAKWSDSPDQFSYFYDDLFTTMPKEDLEGMTEEDIKSACSEFLNNYDHEADKDTWFENMKISAEVAGYALDRKDLKENPDKFKGGIADFAKIIRVSLTGKTRTPDLWTICQVMGEQRVANRLA
ncbi:MAG: glutamate--tRNA ligase family protein [Candidatus Saccharibacteria bacterium]|nr:glutamate--tRNA ligase family protein [Candidatus Saccharibacteria bacterium]